MRRYPIDAPEDKIYSHEARNIRRISALTFAVMDLGLLVDWSLERIGDEPTGFLKLGKEQCFVDFLESPLHVLARKCTFHRPHGADLSNRIYARFGLKPKY